MPPEGYYRRKALQDWINLRDEAIANIQALEEQEFVQVRFPNNYQLYTFRDPSGRLTGGERVIVTCRNGEQMATVVNRGRGSYKGQITAYVKSVLREELL